MGRGVSIALALLISQTAAADQGRSTIPMAWTATHCYKYLKPDGDIFSPTLYSAFPLPRSENEKVVDFAKMGFSDPIPKRFIIGEGGSTRSLILVDRTPGGPLDKQITRLKRSVILALKGKANREEILTLVAQNVAHQVGLAQNVPFPWDKDLKEQVKPESLKMHELAFDHEPIPADFSLPVIRLENFIEEDEAYCLGQALIAWLVLRSFDIPARLHLGANAAFVESPIGHSSVQLEDGRYVDPAGWVVIEPKKEPKIHLGLEPDWDYLPNFRIFPEKSLVGWNAWRFRLQRFLVLVLED